MNQAKTRGPIALIVEDESDVGDMLGEVVRLWGFVPLRATQGRDGVRLAREMHPSVVLLDLVMPRMTGFEVAKRIRTDPSTMDIPVLVLTVMDPCDGHDRAMAAGADEYLRKPFDLDDFQTTLLRLVGMPRSNVAR